MIDREEARCKRCGQLAAGGWTECPDGLWRDLIRAEASGLYVDDILPPRYVLEPEKADHNIVCDDCGGGAEVLTW